MDLESTVASLAPRLLRYTLAVTGVRARAEDAAQEALAALVARWRSHGPPASPEAFSFAVARRRAVRWSVRARRNTPLDAVATPRVVGDPETRAINGQAVELARRALGTLPRGEGEAFRLVVLGELRLREAAQILGIGESAIKMRLARARAKLARMLEGEHDERT